MDRNGPNASDFGYWASMIAAVNWSAIIALAAIASTVFLAAGGRAHERRMKLLEWRFATYAELVAYTLAWVGVSASEQRPGPAVVDVKLPTDEELRDLVGRVAVVGSQSVQDKFNRFTQVVNAYRHAAASSKGQLAGEILKQANDVGRRVGREVQGRRIRPLDVDERFPS